MGFVIAALVVIGVVAFVGGGNTVDGFGKDVENTGDAIQETK